MASSEASSPLDAGVVGLLLRRLRAPVAIAAGRVEALSPRVLLGALVLVQWAALVVVALRAPHDGWVYDAGNRPGAGVVSALPAIVIAQTLVLLPLALVLVHALATRLAGRVFAAWAAVLWLLLPYGGLLYANRSFRHTYRDLFLTHLLGLTADPALPGLVAFLAAGVLALRAVETGAAAEVALSVLATAGGVACAPRAALVAAGPVAVLALGGRRRQAVAAAAGLSVLLAGIGAAVAAGLLPEPFGHVGVPTGTLGSLKENFWSGRVLEWLTIAGIVGALRGRLRAGALIAISSLAAFLSMAVPFSTTLDVPTLRNVALLRAALPSWWAITLSFAALVLLVPRARTRRPAGEVVQRLWLRLQAPVLAPRAPSPSIREESAPAAAAAAPGERAVATPLWAAVALGCLFVLMAFVGIWNAAKYPIALGYDASDHLAYADGLIYHGQMPSGTTGEYYTPPGFYAIAGAATWVGQHIGLADPHRGATYLNVVFVLATAALLLFLARLLFPRRPTIWVAAVGFFALLPVVPKTAAMFHPETLNMLVNTGAFTLATWMLVKRRFALRWLAALGALLGAGQLVRSSSIATFAAVGIAFAAAIAVRGYRRHMPLRRLAIAVGALVLLASPWYVRQTLKYHTQPLVARAGFVHSLLHPGSQGPRPQFFSLSVGEILHTPVRPYYKNEAFSETYTEIWGDWIGTFAWSGYSQGPSPEALTVLQDQSLIGILPTLLSIAGWLAIVGLAVARRVERIPFLPVILLPAIALLGYLWRSYGELTPDGDLFKASYLLLTAPIWALGFGVAFEWLARRRLLLIGLTAAFIIFGVLELRFVLYGVREHHPIF